MDELPDPIKKPEDVLPKPPVYRLYSPQHVGIASIIGGPGAGAVVLSLNYQKLGNSRGAVASLTLGILAVLALALVGLALPDDFRLGGIGVGLAVAMLYVAKGLQGQAYEAHLAVGGRKASGWRAAGIGVIAMGLIVGSWFILATIATSGMGDRVTFGRDQEIYYSGGATEADARRLGKALKDLDIFDGTSPKTVAVEPFNDGFAVSFVVQDGTWDDPTKDEGFRQLGQAISDAAFDGATVQVRLCNDALTSKKEILILRRDLRLPGT